MELASIGRDDDEASGGGGAFEVFLRNIPRAKVPTVTRVIPTVPTRGPAATMASKATDTPIVWLVDDISARFNQQPR